MPISKKKKCIKNWRNNVLQVKIWRESAEKKKKMKGEDV